MYVLLLSDPIARQRIVDDENLTLSKLRITTVAGCLVGLTRGWRKSGACRREQRRGTHVYMHCIAKTLLTELHLAILVPLSRLSFSRVYRWSSSPLMRFSLSSPNLRFSILSFFFSWRIIHWRDEDSEQRRERRRRRRHCASSGIVGSRGGVGKPMGQDSETWNGIPEFLILLVNKCLGDSLLVRSYRPSSVSRRHCVLRFHLVFRSNGFP